MPEKTSQILKTDYKEIIPYMDSMRMIFDIVRLVDAEECREVSIAPDGNIRFGTECYHVWKTNHRCANCTSYRSCHTRKKENRAEFFEGKKFLIQSLPVELTLPDSNVYSCNMELINITETGDNGKHEEKPEWETSEYISTHDPLTGILNWDGFSKRARALISDHPDVNHLIISINIDNFMLISSLYGNTKGNDVLVGIAQLLTELCGPDTVYCRRSGYNFAICIRNTADIPDLLRDIASRASTLAPSHNLRLSMHFGIYDIENINLPISIMCDRAYMAAEAIKYNEHVIYNHFDEVMLKKIVHDQLIINEFKKNLHSGQFVVYLQPQVGKDHLIKGAECLVRWILPTGDMLPPFEFIDVLEEHGLIGSLDEYVWEFAAKQLSQWKGTKYESLYLSVNVSPRDFYYLDIVNVFKRLCRKYGIDPAMLHIEITETALADETQKNLGTLKELKQNGFIVEIDDFGKGSSSLGLLKDLHADVLKLDKQFIQNSTNEKRSLVILESILGMAQKLAMGVIAEGVETSEQLDILTELGCRMFQGYYFSKPVPLASFEKIVKDQASVNKGVE